MESNWTHVPHGYKNEPEMIKKLYDKIMKQEIQMQEKVNKQKESNQVDKHTIDHLKMENTKQKYLLEDLMDLVDMFATGNVDLRFYKRVRKDYLDSLQSK
jgi:hypothetical protein